MWRAVAAGVMFVLASCAHAADVPVSRTADTAAPARATSPAAAPIATTDDPATSRLPAASFVALKLEGDVSGAFPADSSGRPRTPIIFRDDCLPEDCSAHFKAFACAPALLHTAQSDASAIVGRTRTNDTVEVTARDLYVTSPAAIEIRRGLRLGGANVDSVYLAPGDTLYEIHPASLEESPIVWYRGRATRVAGFWATRHDFGSAGMSWYGDSTIAIAHVPTAVEDWWHVKTRSGTTGWWRNASTDLLSVNDMSYWEDRCPPTK